MTSKQFLNACRQGDLHTVEYLWSSVKSKTWEGGLKIACKYDHQNLVCWFFDHFTNIKMRFLYDLIQVVCAQQPQQHCLQSIINVIVKNIHDASAYWNQGMMGACEGGHFDIVRDMIQRGANEWNDALAIACRGGNIDIVQYLIQRGANHWVDGMLFACEGGHLEIVQQMIERGAINCDEIFWNEGMFAACEYGHLHIVLEMIKHGANNWNSGMQLACEKGHKDIVEKMIQHGADDWNRGLKAACESGHHEIIQLMIQHGANDWNEGLISACYGGELEIVRDMVDRGANHWNQGLLAACRSQYRNIDILVVKEMLKYQIDCFDDAITDACISQRMDMVELLIEFGSNHNWHVSNHNWHVYFSLLHPRSVFSFVKLWLKKDPNAIISTFPRFVIQLLNCGIGERHFFDSSIDGCKRQRKWRQNIVQHTLGFVQYINAVSQVVILPSMSYCRTSKFNQ